jgi:ABC-type transport system involved in cytochrome c biogenesis permease component
MTGVVGLVEVALAGHRGAAFAFIFVFSSALGALVVRRRDLATSIIAPPLLYCVLIAALSVVDTHDQSGGFVTRKAVYIGNAFVTGAPTLWAGTAVAAAIVWYRHRANRKPRS